MLAVVAHVILAGSLLSQDSFQKIGSNHWERITTGAFEHPVLPRISVKAPGHVVVQGGSGSQITYKLRQRVRARSEAEARKLLGSVTHSILPEKMVLVFSYNPDPDSELVIQVPRNVAVADLQATRGDIEAYDLDGSISARTNGGMIRCDRIKGGVIGHTGGGEIRLGKIGGAARCTNGAGSITIDSVGGEASCRTIGGEITLREGMGALVLSTEGGNILVDRAGGNVEAHSGEGLIEIGQANGFVLADTRGGSIQVGSARGVKCDSAQGAVRVKTASGPLRVNTSVGSILAELLPGTRVQDALLAAGTGDVTVLIPSNISLSVMARNEAGGQAKIVSEFPDVRIFGWNRPPVRGEGSINGGGPLLRINVADGTIFLRRLK
ncbi:MAG TPA: hypothetical protein VGP79_10365 [Bryobacteraceae bacterium]|nr:hypothetical protein [Bryobacteraceae bacterium]